MVRNLYKCNINCCSVEGVIKQSGLPLARLNGLAQFLERFEAKVNAAAKNEVSNLRLCEQCDVFLL